MQLLQIAVSLEDIPKLGISHRIHLNHLGVVFQVKIVIQKYKQILHLNKLSK